MLPRPRQAYLRTPARKPDQVSRPSLRWSTAAARLVLSTVRYTVIQSAAQGAPGGRYALWRVSRPNPPELATQQSHAVFDPCPNLKLGIHWQSSAPRNDGESRLPTGNCFPVGIAAFGLTAVMVLSLLRQDIAIECKKLLVTASEAIGTNDICAAALCMVPLPQ